MPGDAHAEDIPDVKVMKKNDLQETWPMAAPQRTRLGVCRRPSTRWTRVVWVVTGERIVLQSSFQSEIGLIPVTSSPVVRVPSRARQQGYFPGGREPGRSPVRGSFPSTLMPGRSYGSGPSIAGEASASYLNLLNPAVMP
jgi:hypothetical protein